MKLCNILVNGETHLALSTPRGIVDAAAAGFPLSMDAVIAGGVPAELRALAEDGSLPAVESPVFANVVNTPRKLLCVGRNYAAHALGANHAVPTSPLLFSKFSDSLTHHGAVVPLPAWESHFDAEAELVIVIGRTAYNVTEAEAGDYIFGYTCGNDVSCRPAQNYSSQWLIG